MEFKEWVFLYYHREQYNVTMCYFLMLDVVIFMVK